MISLESIPNITKWIRLYGQVPIDCLLRLAEMLSLCNFSKKHAIVKEGERAAKAYFIEEGMTRSFWLVDGEEVTTSFSVEGSIVFSMDEMYYGIPSQEYVETVEPVRAYSILLADLRKLVTTDIHMATWWSRIHQEEYRRLHRSHKERLTMSAAERYKAFALHQPEACRRARLTDIASYLGITPSTLSRIRAKK